MTDTIHQKHIADSISQAHVLGDEALEALLSGDFARAQAICADGMYLIEMCQQRAMGSHALVASEIDRATPMESELLPAFNKLQLISYILDRSPIAREKGSDQRFYAWLDSFTFSSSAWEGLRWYARSRALLAGAEAAEAHVNAEIALRYFESCDLKGAVAFCYQQIGVSHFQRRNYPQAIETLQHAKSLFDTEGNVGSSIETELTLFRVFSAKGDYQECLSGLKLLLARCATLGLDRLLAEVTLELGKTHLALSHFEPALHYLTLCRDQFRAFADEYKVALCVGHIASTYDQMGEFVKALEYYTEAIDSFGRMGLATSVANYQSNLAIVYKLVGDDQTAFRLFNEAVETARAAGDRFQVARNMGNIGASYLHLEQYSEAEPYVRFAIDTLTEIGYNALADIFRANLGSILQHLRRFDEAMEVLVPIQQTLAQRGQISDAAVANGSIGCILLDSTSNFFDPISGEEILRQTIEVLRDSGRLSDEVYFLRVYSQHLRAQGRWNEYALYHDMFFEKHRLLISQEAKQKSVSVEFRMQMEAVQREKNVAQDYASKLERALEEVNTLNENLRQKNAELQQLSQERAAFLEIAAHDLKNPLQAIRLSLDLVEKYADKLSTNEIVGKLGTIRTSSERMLDLVIRYLSLSSIETGALQIDVRPTNVSEAVGEAVRTLFPLSSKKQIRIDTFISPGLVCLADTKLLAEVVENLVANAIKYSPRDTVVVVRGFRENSHVEIHVQDEGPGISDAELPLLFRKFTKLSTRPTEGEPSTGLGLSIVKNLVERMGGEVSCTSVVGHGANFIVRLKGV